MAEKTFTGVMDGEIGRNRSGINEEMKFKETH
jgi:hypothetical protein